MNAAMNASSVLLRLTLGLVCLPSTTALADSASGRAPKAASLQLGAGLYLTHGLPARAAAPATVESPVFRAIVRGGERVSVPLALGPVALLRLAPAQLCSLSQLRCAPAVGDTSPFPDVKELPADGGFFDLDGEPEGTEFLVVRLAAQEGADRRSKAKTAWSSGGSLLSISQPTQIAAVGQESLVIRTIVAQDVILDRAKGGSNPAPVCLFGPNCPRPPIAPGGPQRIYGVKKGSVGKHSLPGSNPPDDPPIPMGPIEPSMLSAFGEPRGIPGSNPPMPFPVPPRPIQPFPEHVSVLVDLANSQTVSRIELGVAAGRETAVR